MTIGFTVSEILWKLTPSADQLARTDARARTLSP